MSSRALLFTACAILACTSVPTATRESTCALEVSVAHRLAGALRNLILYEESYFADSVNYTSNLAVPQPWLGYPNGFDAGPDVEVVIKDVSPMGWRATAVHPLKGVRCVVYIGVGPQEIPGMREGEPACETM
jgi:hypothetical protein